MTHDPLPVVMADAAQMEQVFVNLLGNAIKFRGPAQPRIHVGATRADGAWTFSVKDNGIGIDPGDLDQIFEIFRRLHGGGKYPGAGIGLGVCKKIIERHGGRIWVESREAQGATFYFTVPHTSGGGDGAIGADEAG